MKQKYEIITVKTHGPGLVEFTDDVAAFLCGADIEDGLLTCFIRHTSASLLIQENADPDVQKDLQDFFARLARTGPRFRHTAEGPDDMPSHIRAALTQIQSASRCTRAGRRWAPGRGSMSSSIATRRTGAK
jgi:secondary thiamine-phosphate synthase enzyme